MEYVISALGNRCKDVKLRLWRDYKRDSAAETKENRQVNVPEDQWNHFVDMKFTPKWKRMQDRTTKSRKNHKTPHLCGRRSFAKKRRDIKTRTGRTLSRAEFVIETRKKTNGTFVSDEAKKRADELTLLLAQNPPTQVSCNVTSCLGDEYSRVFGPERSGIVRCVGRGPTPSKLIKRSTAVRSEAADAEVGEMKTQITSLTVEVQSLKDILKLLVPPCAGDEVSQWAAYANMLRTPNFSFLPNFTPSGSQ